MRKYDLIHSLPAIKLVIGNGFDLYCGLETRYVDYFNSRKEKFDSIRNCINQLKNVTTKKFIKEASINELIPHVFPGNRNIKEINVWDFLFAILSDEHKDEIEDWNWCDVESVMAKWLKDEPHSENECDWNIVFEALKNNVSKEPMSFQYRCLAAFVLLKNNLKAFENEDAYFAFLLEQLNQFEKDFGRYIQNQLTNRIEMNFCLRERLERFSSDSERTIQELCSQNRITSIDTFNYDAPSIEGLYDKFHHINGDLESPIFGVDTTLFKADDSRFIFTKTSRRMHLDMMRSDNFIPAGFSNVIVFGHSLNRADDNYFFSIFDKLDITNPSNNSKIVFAYYVYDSQRRNEIISCERNKISILFQEYSKYKFGDFHGNRLLDELTIQGKIIMYEIPTLPKNYF